MSIRSLIFIEEPDPRGFCPLLALFLFRPATLEPGRPGAWCRRCAGYAADSYGCARAPLR